MQDLKTTCVHRPSKHSNVTVISFFCCWIYCYFWQAISRENTVYDIHIHTIMELVKHELFIRTESKRGLEYNKYVRSYIIQAYCNVHNPMHVYCGKPHNQYGDVMIYMMFCPLKIRCTSRLCGENTLISNVRET